MKKLIQRILDTAEKSSYQSLILTIIGVLLGLIAWGGNKMYDEQKDYNKQRDTEMQSVITEMQSVNKNQIIFEYRIQNLEGKHIE